MLIMQPQADRGVPEHSGRWSIFCAVIDNVGDMGVCWRLARQLVAEHGIEVDLWVDDWASLGRFLVAQDETLVWTEHQPAVTAQGLPLQDLSVNGVTVSGVTVSGVTVLHWRRPWPVDQTLARRVADSDRVIEAFGCELPDALKQAMADCKRSLSWINLEYLSAEPWVRDCHGLPSPQSLSPLLHKHFFFPGFETGTGGLLRETGLLDQHQCWQVEAQHWRRQLLVCAGFGELAQQSFALVVSVFSYETPALQSWLQALADADERVLCLIPQGRALGDVQRFLGRSQVLAPGSVHEQGALTVAVLPFRSQQSYDQLLSVCDFNLVRGEDSFVRAQWAAKPFMWHIYAQHDGVHIDKLKAFAGLYLEGLPPGTRNAWLAFSMAWNLGEDCRDLWHHLRFQLSDLHAHALKWQQKLSDLPDLATNLVFFDQQSSADKQSTP
jgi:uncharacterized repeat protein (TIGR03837 family)